MSTAMLGVAAGFDILLHQMRTQLKPKDIIIRKKNKKNRKHLAVRVNIKSNAGLKLEIKHSKYVN